MEKAAKKIEKARAAEKQEKLKRYRSKDNHCFKVIFAPVIGCR